MLVTHTEEPDLQICGFVSGMITIAKWSKSCLSENLTRFNKRKIIGTYVFLSGRKMLPLRVTF